MHNYIVWMKDHDGYVNNYCISANSIDHAISMASVLHPELSVVDVYLD